jgi:hypothetical protein
VPRTGHFWYVENPRDGAEAILGFIGKHPVAERLRPDGSRRIPRRVASSDGCEREKPCSQYGECRRFGYRGKRREQAIRLAVGACSAKGRPTA